jgi:DNA-binding NarL/FixJ family response regulator
MAVLGEAVNGQQVFKLVQKTDYDLILLDIAMPGRDGIDTLKQLRIVKPAIPVLILSMYPEDQYEVRAIKAGAPGR